MISYIMFTFTVFIQCIILIEYKRQEIYNSYRNPYKLLQMVQNKFECLFIRSWKLHVAMGRRRYKCNQKHGSMLIVIYIYTCIHFGNFFSNCFFFFNFGLSWSNWLQQVGFLSSKHMPNEKAIEKDLNVVVSRYI